MTARLEDELQNKIIKWSGETGESGVESECEENRGNGMLQKRRTASCDNRYI